VLHAGSFKTDEALTLAVWRIIAVGTEALRKISTVAVQTSLVSLAHL